MTLEEEIESVWLRLCERGPRSAPVTLYVVPSGTVYGLDPIKAMPAFWVEVGTYTRDVELSQLREDVYFAYEQVRRGRA